MDAIPGGPKCDGISRSRESISVEVKILVSGRDEDPERVRVGLISPDMPVEWRGGAYNPNPIGGGAAIGTEIFPGVN